MFPQTTWHRTCMLHLSSTLRMGTPTNIRITLQRFKVTICRTMNGCVSSLCLQFGTQTTAGTRHGVGILPPILSVYSLTLFGVTKTSLLPLLTIAPKKNTYLYTLYLPYNRSPLHCLAAKLSSCCSQVGNCFKFGI